MNEWVNIAVPELMQRARTDEVYQMILHRCIDAERVYLSIIEGMDDDLREQLDDYIALCEELQFQFARLAYHYGREMVGSFALCPQEVQIDGASGEE